MGFETNPGNCQPPCQHKREANNKYLTLSLTCRSRRLPGLLNHTALLLTCLLRPGCTHASSTAARGAAAQPQMLTSRARMP